MLLNRVKRLLLESGKNLGLEVEKEDADSIKLSATINAEKYFDDSIYYTILVYKSGTVHITYTFDEVSKTFDNYELVNEFNDNNSWFKAYITEIKGKCFLKFHYAAVEVADEKAVDELCDFLLNELISDDTLEYLKPILEGDR